jgi:hypothetical protein
MPTPPELKAHWRDLPEPWSQRIEVWPAERAWVEWQERFEKLFGLCRGRDAGRRFGNVRRKRG